MHKSSFKRLANLTKVASITFAKEYLIAMAASAYVNTEERVNDFETWLNSLSDDYQKLASFQRLDVLFRLVALCSPSELYEYSNYMTDLLRRDFVSLLPAELVDRVLSYIDHKSLLRSCCVSNVHNVLYRLCIIIIIISITSVGTG